MPWSAQSLPEKHCNFLLESHKLGNSRAEGEKEGWNRIRMVMAGEMAQLTELESHPAFLRCDGKYNNTASVKEQRPCMYEHNPRSPTRASFSQYPFLYGESADHTMSRSPLCFSSFHPGDAKGSGFEGWVTSASHPGLTPPHHHYNSIHP